MNQSAENHLHQLLDFIKGVEKLKDTLRSGYTSSGRQESVAEHTWRLCLMASLFHAARFEHLDFQKLLKMCLIHDLGEAINGDIPAPEQKNEAAKSSSERMDFLMLLQPLPGKIQVDLLALWDEYEEASTEEAKLAKALDKLETLIRHNQGNNPPDFDYTFNLTYGKPYTDFDDSIAALRATIDEEIRQRDKHQLS